MPYGNEDAIEDDVRETEAAENERAHEDADLVPKRVLKPGEVPYICHDCAVHAEVESKWWVCEDTRNGCDLCARGANRIAARVTG